MSKLKSSAVEVVSYEEAERILNEEMSMILISPENQQFCDNLLLLAEWLDSQDIYFTFADFISRTKTKKIKGKTISHPEFYPLLLEANDDKTGYYHKDTTNKDRVLAVLMLRAAILAGDSFV